MKKLSRREQREQAFILVFEQAVTEKTSEEILTDANDGRDFKPEDFTEQLFLGVEENIEDIDKKIEDNVKGWSIKRISKVTLAILRLAIYEIMYEKNIPVSVTINEAVELAKIYGSTDDASYVNGVLSAVEKSDNWDKEDDK